MGTKAISRGKRRSEMVDVRSAQMVSSEIKSYDRITMHLIINHDHVGSNPKQVIGIFQGYLETKEQPYERRLTVGTVWSPIETGWLQYSDVGLLFLINKAGTGLMVNPSPEEREALADKVVEVSFGKNKADLIVRPGRFIPIEVKDIRKVSLRAPNDPVEIELTLFPR